MDLSKMARSTSGFIHPLIWFIGNKIRSFRFILLRTSRKNEGLICDRNIRCGGGRPHILFDAKSKQYVLWADSASFDGYTVATAPSPKGPYAPSPKLAALDPVHKGLKPADFTIADPSKLKDCYEWIENSPNLQMALGLRCIPS